MTSLSLANGYTREQVMPILGAVESNSEHPIAHAITAAASQLLSKTPSVSEITLPVAENYTAIPGLGAEATVNGQQVLIGSGRFMQSQSIDLKPLGTLSDHVSGETRIYAAIDNVAVAAISVSDPIKEGSVSAISALHDLGLQVAMISGDSKDTADAIAAQTGIDQVIAEVLPAEKLDAVDQLRNKGRKVAFVGDGINDAPALAQADIGIALGTGSDVAIESADVILMSGDLRGVVNALDLSKKTMRNIRQNLFWAFAYNAALIPVAAGALYHSFGWLLSPMLAAAAMALSSVFVVSNALRLRKVSARQPLTS